MKEKSLLWSFTMIIPIILLFFVIGCKTKKSSVESDFYEYNIEQGIKQNEHIYLSEIADSISFIPLETRQECLIADIRWIGFTSEYILIRDDMNQVLLFDREGRFLRRIGRKGKGPGEYITSSDVKISEKNNEIYLYDGIKNSIFVFDPETGECIRSSGIDFFPSDFEIYNDNFLAFYCSAATFPYSGKYFHIYLVDSKNLEVAATLYKRNDLTHTNLNNWERGFIQMYKINNKLFCRDSDSDTTVFLDNKMNVINGYMLSYGKYKIPSSVKHNRHWEVEGDYFFAHRVMESGNYLFIQGIYQGKYARNILYNKRNHISKNVVFNYDFHDVGFHNDLDGGIPFWPKGVIDRNILYDHISPIQLIRLMGHEYYKNIPIKNTKKNQLLKQLLQDCEITDNPIIFKLFLK